MGSKKLGGVDTKYRIGQPLYLKIKEDASICQLYRSAANLLQIDKDILINIDQFLKDYYEGYDNLQKGEKGPEKEKEESTETSAT